MHARIAPLCRFTFSRCFSESSFIGCGTVSTPIQWLSIKTDAVTCCDMTLTRATGSGARFESAKSPAVSCKAYVGFVSFVWG